MCAGAEENTINLRILRRRALGSTLAHLCMQSSNLDGVRNDECRHALLNGYNLGKRHQDLKNGNEVNLSATLSHGGGQEYQSKLTFVTQPKMFELKQRWFSEI